MATDGAPPNLPHPERYPAIGDYGFLGDGYGVALVSTAGSIDWACLRRIDDRSTFGRLLDWDRGGWCRIAPVAPVLEVERRYIEGTLVLETTFRTAAGSARLTDLLVLDAEGRPLRQLVRLVEGLEGEVAFGFEIVARFDYGRRQPAVCAHGDGRHSLVGGDQGLLVWSDLELDVVDHADLYGSTTVAPGQRRYLVLDELAPHLLDEPPAAARAEDVDRLVDSTVVGWRLIQEDEDAPAEAKRSALVLRALANADTGAIAAAATTSLPEVLGEDANWDYRYSWIRDSWMAVRSLAEIGDVDCADRFRRFIERSAAGHVEQLQIAVGVGGQHDLTERTLDHLEGWRGSTPVRIGNAAATQLQLDAFGQLVELTWRWHERGRGPDAGWWRYLTEVVDHTADRWREPDSGIWEIREAPRHHVHSKAFAWAALDRGVRLAATCGGVDDVRVGRWRTEADACRAEILRRGVVDGHLVEVLDAPGMDAGLLLLPTVGFLDWDDPLMVATVDAVLDRLVVDGFVRRHEGWDGEGAFLACTFWLVEALVHQDRLPEARSFFGRAMGTANDLGLFAEEWDTRTLQPLGNFPQALTHLSHISAALALERAGG